MNRPNTIFPVEFDVTLKLRAVFKPCRDLNDFRQVVSGFFGYRIQRFLPSIHTFYFNFASTSAKISQFFFTPPSRPMAIFERRYGEPFLIRADFLGLFSKLVLLLQELCPLLACGGIECGGNVA